ncbi:MAG: serine hydrolase [SAR324 cluster bacterium]|nr:serine hydrolase [SAR324 cluster bacterium]
MIHRGTVLRACGAFLVLAAFSAPTVAQEYRAPACPSAYDSFGWGEPEALQINAEKLLELAEWIEADRVPLLSLVLSRHGKIFFELYTSSIERDQAHYLMSVTKSVTSALVGVLLDRKLIRGVDQPLAEILPAAVFPDAGAIERFRAITLKHVLAMSALDAPIAPHSDTAQAKTRVWEFYQAVNRVTFALDHSLVSEPGRSFQYTDVTPQLAAGAIQYVAGMSLLELANQTLFDPMGFENQDWMHQDRSGIDLAAYGIRLRPVDMQKFGILYLNHGCWEGKQLLSREWVERSFTPWIASPGVLVPNYGWYWWKINYGAGWTGHTADGWLGQRITVFPAQGIVVTMTALIDDGSEHPIFTKIITRFLKQAVRDPFPDDGDLAEVKRKLRSAMDIVRNAPSRIRPNTERRMVPSVNPKEQHRPFVSDLSRPQGGEAIK